MLCWKNYYKPYLADNFTPEAFTYGVLEGMALELYQMYQIIRTGTYIQVTRMIGSGNGLRKNPVLCEIIEEIFGIKLIWQSTRRKQRQGSAIQQHITQIYRKSEVNIMSIELKILDLIQILHTPLLGPFDVFRNKAWQCRSHLDPGGSDPVIDSKNQKNRGGCGGGFTHRCHLMQWNPEAFHRQNPPL